MDLENKGGKKYSQIWYVLDQDSLPKKQVFDLFLLSSESGIKIAFSNRCIELWFLLHFQLFESKTSSATEYKDRLTKEFKRYKIGQGIYRKNDKNIYDYLSGREEEAIKNAEILLKKSDSNPLVEPWTNVHQLIRILLKLRNFT